MSRKKFFLRASNLEEARRIQNKLRKKVSLKTPFASLNEIKTVAGMDVHFSKDEKLVSAGIVICSFPEMKVLDKTVIKIANQKIFPYIAGFLSFRELPFLLKVYRNLKIEPEVILCDGQGIAHPRRMGLATHLGIILDKPTIGCAKTLLYPAPARRSGVYGQYEKLPGRFKGSYSYLRDRMGERGEKGNKGEKGEIVGAVLRTKDNVRSVFVSPGHRMNLKQAIEIVLRCCTKYRLPEPLRFAHQIAQIAANISSDCQ